MSMEAVWAFRERVDKDSALADAVRAEMAKGADCDLAAVARRHGFEFTREELSQGWATLRDGELTPLELELAGGGAPPSVCTSGGSGDESGKVY